ISLFTGDAGSGESEIRRWILEKDLLETIVALPDQLFYNTGINTYLWFVTNRKSKERKGKVQLIDARTFFKKTRKSLGSKRHEIDTNHKKEILDIYESFTEGEFSKIFKTTDFAYRQITIERPLRLKFDFTDAKIKELLEVFDIKDNKTGMKDFIESFENQIITNKKVLDERIADYIKQHKTIKLTAGQYKKFISIAGECDENSEICVDKDGNIEPDGELRDYENVPFEMDIYEYFNKEVKPYVPDAWINESVVDHKDSKVGVVGYEIPFTRYFYKYEAPRSLEAIETDIERVENELLDLLKQL
ncbi:MAG: type restriction enzyme protein, partial [Patescibacteria group bacterium]|nr:type restriction enzyme protein [Patescibacteria group bacterium]